MKAYDVKKMSYRDKVARRNRAVFILKLAGFFVASAMLIGAGIYLFFFTDKLSISDITISGLKTLSQDDVMASLDRQMGTEMFYLNTQKNIIFFDADRFEEEFTDDNPVIKSIDVRKNLPNKLSVEVIERKPAGTWCSVGQCRYFDQELATWGEGIKSSGFLLLTIEDKRPLGSFMIDNNFFPSINNVINNISGATVKSVVIPEDSFNEFRVYTDKSFYIIFSLDSDIGEQLKILKIYLDDKSADPEFAPEYLDLRVDGRVYSK